MLKSINIDEFVNGKSGDNSFSNGYTNGFVESNKIISWDSLADLVQIRQSTTLYSIIK